MGRKYTKRLSKRMNTKRKNTRRKNTLKSRVSKRKNTLNRRNNLKRLRKKRLFKWVGGGCHGNSNWQEFQMLMLKVMSDTYSDIKRTKQRALGLIKQIYISVLGHASNNANVEDMWDDISSNLGTVEEDKCDEKLNHYIGYLKSQGYS